MNRTSQSCFVTKKALLVSCNSKEVLRNITKYTKKRILQPLDKTARARYTRRIDSRNFIAQVAARDEYTQAMDNSEPEMVEARYSGHVECHPLVQLQKTLDRDAG